jgi:hypothetical protein
MHLPTLMEGNAAELTLLGPADGAVGAWISQENQCFHFLPHEGEVGGLGQWRLLNKYKWNRTISS